MRIKERSSGGDLAGLDRTGECHTDEWVSVQISVLGYRQSAGMYHV